MNDKRYRWILYIIILVIISTIGIQIYWNYKNYLTNKQQLINDVQVSLDKAVDDYYAALAERTTLGLSLKGDAQKNVLNDGGFLEQITAKIDTAKSTFIGLDSLAASASDGITILRGFKADSMMTHEHEKNPPMSIDSFSSTIRSLKKTNDSVNISNFELLTSKIVISISNDSLDLKAVDSLMKIELLRKNIAVDFDLIFNKNDEKHFKTEDVVFMEGSQKGLMLSTFSRSTFLPKDSSLSILFTNETRVVLGRIMGGILISTLLVLAVISCLFYLLGIIKRQKQLAEVKNDLISNITHEFKTPIATIGVALESIKDFEAIEDKEKTERYLDMSNTQLSKLNLMVEKLLETATLDSDNLNLNKEEINITDLLNTLVSKHQIQSVDKTITFDGANDNVMVHVDLFHFESAMNNLLDNAMKYGGNEISVHVGLNKDITSIRISDNGKTMSKAHKDRVFEKFYRIPKGNTHDVKGFGIGLYYTKKIIEKHGGHIALDLSNNLTSFKISLPNG